MFHSLTEKFILNSFDIVSFSVLLHFRTEHAFLSDKVDLANCFNKQTC